MSRDPGAEGEPSDSTALVDDDEGRGVRKMARSCDPRSEEGSEMFLMLGSVATASIRSYQDYQDM